MCPLRVLGALLGLLALALAAAVVGIGVTSVWPTDVQTSSYAATLRLSAEPDQLSSVHAPTLFGNLDLRFDGPLPAPGVSADARVRDRITAVLATKDLSVSALKPGAAEIDAAISSGASSLAGKYAAGVLLTCALAAFALRHWRSAEAGLRPWRRSAPVPALAAVVALAGTGGSAWATFRPDRLETVQADGLLGYVRSNTRILSDVQARSAQAEPYVKNMLALSAALQEHFVPPDLARPAAVKLLLVSDIHGANAYPLMRQIVQTEGITAVVDTGDLLNFGHAQEGEAAGMYAGIASLGVPYVFVRGNHDASAATDESVLRRLATIPNVILLEPTAGTYTVATIGGLQVAGFNDPRWFGDEGGDTAGQVAAARRFDRAMEQVRSGRVAPVASTTRAGTPAPAAGETAPGAATSSGAAASGATTSGGASAAAPPATTPGASPDPTASAAVATDLRRGLDLLVAHEPYAADAFPAARVRLNGHMHSAALRGNRIQLGTFTGGGVVAHYSQDPAGAELNGQPYAFDILSYGADCRLETLTRYSYRDLLEGRPVYDDVRAVNGRSIQAPQPSAGRVCRADAPLTLATVVADAPDPSSSPTPATTSTTP
nr:metallophosphoesterase family protein [Arsenicicoccus dermatophilus]